MYLLGYFDASRRSQLRGTCWLSCKSVSPCSNGGMLRRDSTLHFDRVCCKLWNVGTTSLESSLHCMLLNPRSWPRFIQQSVVTSTCVIRVSFHGHVEVSHSLFVKRCGAKKTERIHRQHARTSIWATPPIVQLETALTRLYAVAGYGRGRHRHKLNTHNLYHLLNTRGVLQAHPTQGR